MPAMSTAPVASSTPNRLTLDTLESWLWEFANILRGSIDSIDFKNYIFGLLFLKRFNDVFDERVRLAEKEEGLSKKQAEEEVQDKWGPFPLAARWLKLIARTESIGEALDKAFATIEAHNPELQHVLTASVRKTNCFCACAIGSGKPACRPRCHAFAPSRTAGPVATRRTCWSFTLV